MGVKRGADVLSCMHAKASTLALYASLGPEIQAQLAMEMTVEHRAQLLSGIPPLDAVQLLASLNEEQCKTAYACMDADSLGKIATGARLIMHVTCSL